MPSTQAEPQTLLTVAEVAERLRVSPWSVYRRVASGELRALRIGTSARGPLRFEPSALRALLRPALTLEGDDDS
jgi:excisionase family DNA binding protein